MRQKSRFLREFWQMSTFLEAIWQLIERQSQRPSWDEYFMAGAFLISARSSCERLHVGCILVTTGEYGNRILASGYNGFLAGAPHQSCLRENHEQATIHAEQNAVTDAAKRGVSIHGSIAYITHFPCIHCAKILAAAGISQIKYCMNYRNDPLVIELLERWQIPLTRCPEESVWSRNSQNKS